MIQKYELSGMVSKTSRKGCNVFFGGGGGLQTVFTLFGRSVYEILLILGVSWSFQVKEINVRILDQMKILGMIISNRLSLVERFDQKSRCKHTTSPQHPQFW